MRTNEIDPTGQLATLYTTCFADMVAAARVLVRNQVVAEDCAQEAFVRVCHHWERIAPRPPVQQRAYLAVTVRHVAIDWLRHQTHFHLYPLDMTTVRHLDDGMDMHNPAYELPDTDLHHDPERHLLLSEQVAEARRAVHNPRNWRIAELLASGCSIPETAAMLHLSPSGVKMAVWRLREDLGPEAHPQKRRRLA